MKTLMSRPPPPGALERAFEPYGRTIQEFSEIVSEKTKVTALFSDGRPRSGGTVSNLPKDNLKEILQYYSL